MFLFAENQTTVEASFRDNVYSQGPHKFIKRNEEICRLPADRGDGGGGVKKKCIEEQENTIGVSMDEAPSCRPSVIQRVRGEQGRSQFSALTLRRAFKLSGPANSPAMVKKHHYHYNHQLVQQQHRELSLMKQPDNRGKSSQGNLITTMTTAGDANTLPPHSGASSIPADDVPLSAGARTSLLFLSSSTHERPRSVGCDCCCCTNKCAAADQRIPSSSSSSNNLFNSMSSSTIRSGRTVLKARGLANQHTGARANAVADECTPLGGSGNRRRGWQKTTTTRKPIPVPPPIVPLHRQLACGLRDPAVNPLRQCDGVYENSPRSAKQKTMTFRLDFNEADDDKCTSLRHHENLHGHDNPNLSHKDLIRPVRVSGGESMVSTVRNSASKKSDITGGDSSATTGRSDGSPKTDHDYEGNWIKLSETRESGGGGKILRRASFRPCRPLSARGLLCPNPQQSSSSLAFSSGSSAKLLSDDDDNSRLNFNAAPVLSDRADLEHYPDFRIEDASYKLVSHEVIPFLSNPSRSVIALSGDRDSVSGRNNSDLARIKTTIAAICVGEHQNDIDAGGGGDLSLDTSGEQQQIIAAIAKSGSSSEVVAKYGRFNGDLSKVGRFIRPPIVDINSKIYEGNASTSPQTIQRLPTTEFTQLPLVEKPISSANENQHEHRQQDILQCSSTLSAIYDLPESGGAREFVRVEVSDGRRTVTAARLPLMPARRPAMPPPPPPPPPHQQQQRGRTAVTAYGGCSSAADAQPGPDAQQRGTNSGCVVANFSVSRAPNSTSNVGAHSSSTAKNTTRYNQIECKNQNQTELKPQKHFLLDKLSPVIDVEREKETHQTPELAASKELKLSPRIERTTTRQETFNEKGSTLARNQSRQFRTNQVVRFKLETETPATCNHQAINVATGSLHKLTQSRTDGQQQENITRNDKSSSLSKKLDENFNNSGEERVRNFSGEESCHKRGK